MDSLRFVAKRESSYLEDFEFYGKPVISSDFIELDRNALAIMEKGDLASYGIPSLVTGDGNCLFNALSIALTGNEDMALELRLRTSIDMALNGEIYKSRRDYDELNLFSPTYEDSIEACCTEGAYSSIWTMISASVVIGKPIQSLYPQINGHFDKTHQTLTKTFFSQGKGEECLTILWSRMGPVRQKTWTANHFVAVFPSSKASIINVRDTSPLSHTPKASIINIRDTPSVSHTPTTSNSDIHDTPSVCHTSNTSSNIITNSTPLVPNRKRKAEFSMIDEDGNEFKIYKVECSNFPNPQLINEASTLEAEIPDETHSDEFPYDTEHSVLHENENAYANSSTTSTQHDKDSTIESPDRSQTLPTPKTVIALTVGKWHSAEDAYNLIHKRENVNDVVPVGKKSNCYLLVDNSRNMRNLQLNKKCEFYDDCGVWDYTKGHTVKTTYVIENGSLRTVALKDQKYCTKRRQKGAIIWEPLSSQPSENQVVTLSRYYATHKTDPNFKKRVSFFFNDTCTIGHTALFEYQGMHPVFTAPHGNSGGTKNFVRTYPATFDKIQQNILHKQPKEIYGDLKRDDSLTCVRDFDVIRNKKYNDKKKEKKVTSAKSNIADEILDIFGMINHHPFVQTIIQHKGQVPAIICYTSEQIKDLKHFLTHTKDQPLGIDRTFNLGSFYATTIVYKNQRLVRKNSKENPIFLGPIMLHKDAAYKTYKGFLEHIATEVDSDIEPVELRVSERMEFGSDDEKALTKAIEHVFPSAKRLLCTKHLKDNVKHYCQNKVGMQKSERDDIMRKLFGDDGIVNSDTTLDFETRSSDLDEYVKEKHPAFALYFQKYLKSRLNKNVYAPRRMQDEKKTSLD